MVVDDDGVRGLRRTVTVKPCAHLRIEYVEPNGPKSRGKCMDCKQYTASLPNSPVYKPTPFGTTSKHRASTIRQWPQRKKAAGGG